MKQAIFKSTVYFSIFLGLLSCGGDNSSDANHEQQTYPLKTVSPIPVVFRDKVLAIGRLSYKDEYKLSFKTSGIIEKVLVKNGESVEQGQALAILKLEEIKAKTNQTEEVLAKAKRDLERIEGLYNDSVATLEQLQNAKTQLNMAQMDYESADFNLQHAVIKAPEKGIVQKVMFKENEAVQAGATIVVFGSVNSMKVLSTSLSDLDVFKIDVGDSVTVKFDALPEKQFNGLVEEIVGMADPLTGTYEVCLKINDPEKLLMPGLIGNAVIRSSKRKSYLQIPIDALVYGNKEQGNVYTTDGTKALLRHISIAKITGDKLLVNNGISVNNIVIIEGQHRFSGDTVILY